MALYIKDPDVDALAAALAAAKKMNKTEAVREALQHELERERGKPTTADLAVRFCRELKARSRPKRGRAADKSFYDELSGHD
jgi:antitoxin VapB